MAQNMQAARREETRERILAAAEKVIIEKGVRDASLKDISKGAKISAGTLYYHFNTKDSIMFELAERNLKRMTAGIVEKIAVEGEDSCSTQMFAEALDQVLKESMQARLHLYLISNAGISDSISERYQKQYAKWRRSLKTHFLESFSEERANVLAYLVLTVFDGLMIQRLFGAEEIPTEEIARILLGEEYRRIDRDAVSTQVSL